VETLAKFGANIANNGVECTSGLRTIKQETALAVLPLLITCGSNKNSS